MRRFWIALLVSLAIHALLLLAVRVPRRTVPPGDVEVEIVQGEPPPVPAPRAPEPAPPVAQAPRPRARRERAKPAPAPQEAAPVAQPPGEGAPPGTGEARALNLDTRYPFHAGPPEPPPPPPLTEEQVIQTRIDGFWREFKGKEAAEFHDQYWSGVKKELEKGFSPPSAVVKSGPTTAPSLFTRMLKTYLAEAAAYGRTGNPYGDDALDERGRAQLDDATAAGRPDRARAGSYHSTYDHEIAVIVQLRQDGKGTVIGAEVLESSGNPSYDRLALQQVRGIDLSGLGPPIGGRRTLWAFQTLLHTQPPLPQAGCSFDAYFQIGECYWPLKETIRSHVSLVALYDDEAHR